MAKLRFSAHILEVTEERGIAAEWVERTLVAPEWTEADAADVTLRRALLALPERGGRVLRVVYRDGETFFAVTAFFDRGARRP